jgi:hypothetical protein
MDDDVSPTRDDSWQLVDKAPFYLLVPDVIDTVNEFLPWRDQLSFRLSSRRVAVQQAAAWSAVATVVKEARRTGRRVKATEIALAVSVLALGVAVTGGTLVGIGGIVYVAGATKAGLEAAALVAYGITLPAIKMANRSAETIREVAERPVVNVDELVRSERAWDPRTDFDVIDEDAVAALRGETATDVVMLVERQRYSVLHQKWSRHALLPIDPPAWECPQLGVPGRCNPVENITDPEQITPHTPTQDLWGRPAWQWIGPWEVVRDKHDDCAADAEADSDDRAPLMWWVPTSVRNFASPSSNRFARTCDRDGWRYGITFTRGGATGAYNTPLDVVRQRTWKRVMQINPCGTSRPE